MTFKIVVLSLMLGIWGLDARSQNEEPDFSGQSEDSLMQALGNIPAFTIYKDNYVVTGTSFTGGKISKYNSDAKFQISLRHRLYRKLLPYRIYLFLTYSQKSFWDIYRKSAPFADNNYNPSLGFGRNFIGEADERAFLDFPFDLAFAYLFQLLQLNRAFDHPECYYGLLSL